MPQPAIIINGVADGEEKELRVNISMNVLSIVENKKSHPL